MTGPSARTRLLAIAVFRGAGERLLPRLRADRGAFAGAFVGGIEGGRVRRRAKRWRARLRAAGYSTRHIHSLRYWHGLDEERVRWLAEQGWRDYFRWRAHMSQSP